MTTAIQHTIIDIKVKIQIFFPESKFLKNVFCSDCKLGSQIQVISNSMVVVS